MSSQCLQPSFFLIWLTIWEQMSFEDFHDGRHGRHGSHLGYWTETILAILYLHVAPMAPTKFQLSLTYNSGDLKMW